MKFRDFLKKGFVVFDGAFGTQLQKAGLILGTFPETLNITNPNLVYKINKAYVDAGADVISTNTFGANRKKFKNDTKNIIKAAIDIAKKAANGKYIALDIGPIGELIEPMGSMSFDEAYDIFKEQIEIAKDDVDLIIIETMTDLYELKAALLAAKENSNLPIICSMSFMENMRTFTGTTVQSFALTASAFADAIGINCSLGPKQIFPIMKELSKWTELPLIVQANAGIPDELMNYPIKEDEFASIYKKYIDIGVTIFGGCCGTTPKYIEKIRELVDSSQPVKRKVNIESAICSSSKVVNIDKITIIGERINPTGKKLMKQALIDENYEYISTQALDQVEAGAEILDVNAGLPEINEKEVLVKLIKFIQSIVDVPLQIDCGKPDAIEKALRYYNGRAIVNSVNGEDKVLDSILPIVKKYNACLVGLTIDENGIPNSVDKRIEIAEKIIKRAKEYGIREEDIYIDCLTLTVSVEKNQARETLEAISRLKNMYRVKFVLGISNISFGLPNRQIVNSTFLKTACAFGLDLPIINPNIKENIQAIQTYLSLKDEYDKEFFYQEFMEAVENNVNYVSYEDIVEEKTEDILYCIKRGLPQASKTCKKLLEEYDPIYVINHYLIPALNIVGEEYEKGKIFLPQLISAAESAKLCFNEIKLAMPNKETNRGSIILATVKGDIHDIGKNIVKTVLENYGYKIIDLGKNVEPQVVVDMAKKHNIKLVGLSALMTTTVGAMEETIKLLKEQLPDVKTFVGGAVLNEDYAKKIGATWYAKDANQSVKIANQFFNN